MIKKLTLFLFFPFISCSQSQKILSQDYNFLGVDGEVSKLHQSNDTLYELHCYIDRPCQPRPEKHSKIISSYKKGEFTILKLEQLDTIPLSINSYPETRYSTLAIKYIDNKKLGFLPLVLGLTKKQLDTIQTNMQTLKDKFFFTSFSDAYLKELSALKKVTTKEDANEIIETIKSDKFKTLVDRYLKTEISDLYGSGLSAELLNSACIEDGYNPIGAGRVINTLKRKEQHP